MSSTPPQPVLFEGKQVTDTTVKATGTITHVFAKPARDLRQDEVVITIAVFKVGKIAFNPDADGAVREQTIALAELHELDMAELDVRRLLADVRARTRKDVEARYGEAPPGEGIKVTLTRGTEPSEIDAARARIRSIGDDAAAKG